MDKLAEDGIKLDRYYTQFTCTPSRAAFLSGKLPIHVGLQHGQIFYSQPWGLPLEHKLMPQYLERFVG
jgi:arylsulfatase A-like enzyme